MRPDELPEDREVAELLSRLDHPVPPVSVEMVIGRARRAGVERLRWAAGIALALGLAASAAYAAPGSPVPGWIAQAARALGLAAPVADPSFDGAQLPAESAGIALIPGDSLLIEFLEAGLSGYLRVDLTDDAEVIVQAPTGSTRFASEPERLLVEHPTPDTVHVQLPRAGGRVVIRVGARELLQKDGPAVSTGQEAVAGSGYVFSLGSGGG